MKSVTPFLQRRKKQKPTKVQPRPELTTEEADKLVSRFNRETWNAGGEEIISPKKSQTAKRA